MPEFVLEGEECSEPSPFLPQPCAAGLSAQYLASIVCSHSLCSGFALTHPAKCSVFLAMCSQSSAVGDGLHLFPAVQELAVQKQAVLQESGLPAGGCACLGAETGQESLQAH